MPCSHFWRLHKLRHNTHENHLVSSLGIIRVLCIDQHNFRWPSTVSDSSILAASVVLLGRCSFLTKACQLVIWWNHFISPQILEGKIEQIPQISLTVNHLTLLVVDKLTNHKLSTSRYVTLSVERLRADGAQGTQRHETNMEDQKRHGKDEVAATLGWNNPGKLETLKCLVT